AAGGSELDRDHARVADDLAAVRLDLSGGGVQVLDFDREVMDAGSSARRARLRGLGVGVVLDQREVDPAVGEMARSVVTHPFGVDFDESEHLLVELGGLLQVLDLQREMHDTVHVVLPGGSSQSSALPRQARSSGLSLPMSLIVSRRQIASQSLRARAL